MAKTLKNGTPPIRVCVNGLCMLLDVPPDKIDGQAVSAAAAAATAADGAKKTQVGRGHFRYGWHIRTILSYCRKPFPG